VDVSNDTSLSMPSRSNNALTRPVNKRSIVQRSAFDDSINVFSFRSQPQSQSNDTIVDPASSSQSNSSSDTGSYQTTASIDMISLASVAPTSLDVYPVVEVVQSTANDAYFTGMAIDPLVPVVYYTTQQAIYSYNETNHDTVVIIAGMLEVTIGGYNFGFSIEDIISIKLNGNACTSIVHLSENSIKCVLALRELLTDDEISSIYSTDEVELISISGKMLGLSLQPLSLLMSGSGRPIVTSINIQRMPFKPVAIAIALHNDTNGVVKTIYMLMEPSTYRDLI